MIKEIELNNQDTKYTIDTYVYFTGDRFEESELDYMDGGSLTYDDYEWIYDHKNIVNGLAKESIEYLKDLFCLYDGSGQAIIKSIDLISSGSPQYYNYTTDYYIMNVKYDDQLLDEYIKKNSAAFVAYKKDSIIPDEDPLYKITFYIDQFYKDDDYINTIYEKEYEIYSNNVTITKKQKNEK